MSETDTNPPVACTLTAEEDAERPEEVRSTLVSQYTGAVELPDGYTLTFEGTDETLVAVATFTANELKCCSFAEYSIDVSPPFDETLLTITGPYGTKELFGEGMVATLEAES